jgi:uncharacterized protein
MRCPVDKTEMIIVEHKKIELDFCVECHGAWFDSGELELLIERLMRDRPDEQFKVLTEQQDATTSEAKRKCPVCRKNMKKIWMGEEPRVLIDSCPNGHGLWFDGGELNQFINNQKGEPVSKDVLTFLGDTFQSGKRPISE